MYEYTYTSICVYQTELYISVRIAIQYYVAMLDTLKCPARFFYWIRSKVNFSSGLLGENGSFRLSRY